MKCRKTWKEIKRLLAPEGIFVCLENMSPIL